MLGHISFKWKNSILITIVISIILTVVHSFVYFTFQSWSQKQEGLVLEKEIKQFKAKIEDPRFYGELFTPNFLTQQGPIRKEGWGRELEKGQYLRVETNTGKVIIETENDFPSNLINKLKSEKNLFTVHERVNLPYYGNCLISIYSVPGSGLESTLKIIKILLLMATILGIVLTSISSYFISKTTIKPVSDITKKVQSINIHNLKEPLELPKTKDEIYQLADTFNQLLNHLEKSFEQQKWFIADASHELKTPIAVIEGHADMLKRWGKEKPEVLEESIQFILQETDRMKYMVNQLLLLASIETEHQVVKSESVDICQLVQGIVDSIQSLNPFLSFEFSSSKGHISIQIDRFFLEQILINLIENAAKYTQDGGKVTIHLEEIKKKVSITIQDTGIGIPKDDLPNIFNRFYRVDKSRSRKQNGTGLGLSITKNLVDQLGGTIEIESEVMKGTTIYLILPKAREQNDK